MIADVPDELRSLIKHTREGVVCVAGREITLAEFLELASEVVDSHMGSQSDTRNAAGWAPSYAWMDLGSDLRRLAEAARKGTAIPPL